MTATSPHTAAGNQSIGAMLKGRRQDLKLSVQDIATQLRLDPRIVEALESDNYEGLPAPLYVRGYIRGYSKILKLDSNALVELYDSDAPSAPPEIIPEVKHPTQTSSSDKPVKAFTYLVTFTLVILVIAWWQSSFVVKTVISPTAPAPGKAAEQAPLSPRLSDSTTEVRHADDAFYSAPAGEPSTEYATQSQLAATPGAEPGLITGGVSGPDRVVFRMNADSWVEVFDAGGERLFMNLARAGEELSLTGTAPFSVLLGYAQCVSVEFNGHAFDPAPYSHSGIARFTLSN